MADSRSKKEEVSHGFITNLFAQFPHLHFGTLQDRLVVELRLAGACNQEQANALLQDYLPRFNERFAVPAEQKELAYRPWPITLKPEEVFCFKYERMVAADNTIQFGPERLQLQPDETRRSFARLQVEVHEHFDGRVLIFAQGRCVGSREAPLEAPRLRALDGRLSLKGTSSTAQEEVSAQEKIKEVEPASQAPKTSVPHPNHPWRRKAVSAKVT